jgi:hypothetical protein
MMDVRIPGSGDNLSFGARRSMPHILDPYPKAADRQFGAVLTGVFGCNDMRAEHKVVRSRLAIVAGIMPRGTSPS